MPRPTLSPMSPLRGALNENGLAGKSLLQRRQGGPGTAPHLTFWIYLLLGGFTVLAVFDVAFVMPRVWRDPLPYTAVFDAAWVRAWPSGIASGLFMVAGFGLTIAATHTHGTARALLLVFGLLFDLAFLVAFLLSAAVWLFGRPRSLIPPALRR